jgi:general secretion pathway protein A
MYENYYGFDEKPFNLTPDPRFLYLSKQHQGALDHMVYGIREREGFIAVVGDVGMGKTTLCRCLLGRLEDKFKVALILNPMISDIDLLRTCVHDLGVKPACLKTAVLKEGDAEGDVSTITEEPVDPDWIHGASKKQLIDSLNEFLLEQHNAGGSTVLIIDEAQNLSPEVMEQLRMLSNLETEKAKLLQIIFVGQLELNEKLRRPDLKQLNQRISIRYEVTPLSKSETIKYITHRILVAGAGSRISFSHSAMKEIFAYTNGCPRLINLVCDRALLAGFNAQVDTLERSHVNLGIRSLLGEEDKNYFITRLLKDRLPLVVSVIFFLMGLAFFLAPKFFTEKDFRTASVAAETSPVSIPPAALAPVHREGLQVRKPAPVVTKSVSPMVVPRNENPPRVEKSTSASVAPSQSTMENQGKYRVQVFSLSHQGRAESEVKKLQSEGYQAYWRKATSAEQDWYIVFVGPFESVKSAKIHLKALKFSGRKPILLSIPQAS